MKLASDSWVDSSDPISSSAELVEPFLQSTKLRQDFKLGSELEFFIVTQPDLKLAKYSGPSGIAAVLNGLADNFKWEAVLEGPNVIALKRDAENVTLEPSGAVEYVCPPLKTLEQNKLHIENFCSELKVVLSKLNLRALAIGYHPFETVESAPLVPKSRYDIMYKYMPKVGELGLNMMKLTASLQVSIDYDSEADALRKFGLASRAIPLLVALSANSSIIEGRFNKKASYRSLVWTDTDNDRCGFPPFVFGKEQSFEKYVEWALDVPMYMVMREGKRIPMQGINFRQFLEGSNQLLEQHNNPHATKADWELHLSTLFPWVRFRHYIEIRPFDMNSLDFCLDSMALIKGLFYSQSSLSDLEQLVGHFDRETVDLLLHNAINFGLDGESQGLSIREQSRQLLEIAKQGLKEQSESCCQNLSVLHAYIENWSLEEVEKKTSENLKTYLTERLL